MIKLVQQGKAVLRVVGVSISDNDGKDLVCRRIAAGVSDECFSVRGAKVLDGEAV